MSQQERYYVVEVEETREGPVIIRGWSFKKKDRAEKKKVEYELQLETVKEMCNDSFVDSLRKLGGEADPRRCYIDIFDACSFTEVETALEELWNIDGPQTSTYAGVEDSSA